MLSKTSQYAVRAVLYIAIHGKKDKKTGVSEIAEALDIPKYYLAKILRKLASSGIIRSVKGPRGGYYLNSNSDRCALIDIIDVMEGRSNLEQCALGLQICSPDHPCPVHSMVAPFRDSLIDSLEKCTIEIAIEHLEKNDSFIDNLFTPKDRIR